MNMSDHMSKYMSEYMPWNAMVEITRNKIIVFSCCLVSCVMSCALFSDAHRAVGMGRRISQSFFQRTFRTDGLRALWLTCSQQGSGIPSHEALGWGEALVWTNLKGTFTADELWLMLLRCLFLKWWYEISSIEFFSYWLTFDTFLQLQSWGVFWFDFAWLDIQSAFHTLLVRRCACPLINWERGAIFPSCRDRPHETTMTTKNNGC